MDEDERPLERAGARTRQLDRFGSTLAATPLDRVRLIDVAAESIVDEIEGTAVLFVVSPDGQMLDPRTVFHPDDHVRAMITDIFDSAPHGIDAGLVGPVVQSRQPLLMSEVNQDLLRAAYPTPVHHRYFDEHGVYSLVVAPVQAHDRVLGALALAARRDERRYDEDDLELVVGLADRLGLALYNAQLLADAENSANRLAAILETAADAVITISDDGIIESANAAAESMFGWTASDMIGRNVDILMPDHYASRHHEFLEHYRRTGETSVIGQRRELEGRRKDGTVFPIELAVSVVHLGDQRYFTGILRDLSERIQLQNELLRLASTDQLTGLLNRREFCRRVDHLIDRSTADGACDDGGSLMPEAFSILFVDLDDFKVVNDTHGHEVGDKVLSVAARRLTGCLRGEDLAGRWGGDEFVVVTPHRTPEESDANAVSDRICAVMSEAFQVGPHTISIGATVGISTFPHDGRKPSELIGAADRDMYASKRDDLRRRRA